MEKYVMIEIVGEFKLVLINCVRIWKDLISFLEKLIYNIPSWLLNHRLLHHFLRGYVDGDGSFYGHNNKTIEQLVFNLRGNDKFLKQVELVFRQQLGLKPKSIETSSGWPLLRYEGNRVATKIRDYLYKDSTEKNRLERKYKKASEFKYQPHLRKAKAIMAKSIYNKKVLKFISIVEAKRSGFSKSSIYKCLKSSKKIYKGFTWVYV